MDKPPSRIKTVRLPNDPFAQSNGYKPAPLDLANITLSTKLEELIDQLAENTHNVWAKERITQGWTYGLNEVNKKIINAKVRQSRNRLRAGSEIKQKSHEYFEIFQDPDNKRSPHLVPYSNVDDIIKKANRLIYNLHNKRECPHANCLILNITEIPQVKLFALCLSMVMFWNRQLESHTKQVNFVCNVTRKFLIALIFRYSFRGVWQCNRV